jgi:hypothetical protein
MTGMTVGKKLCGNAASNAGQGDFIAASGAAALPGCGWRRSERACCRGPEQRPQRYAWSAVGRDQMTGVS